MCVESGLLGPGYILVCKIGLAHVILILKERIAQDGFAVVGVHKMERVFGSPTASEPNAVVA